MCDPSDALWYSQTSRAVQRPDPRSVTSHGPSGIGFVHFGDIGVLRVEAPIETTGLGARGFNVYDGSLNEAVSTPSPPGGMARWACR